MHLQMDASIPYPISNMKSITYLEDRQSEALSGGHWRSFTRIKVATTSVRQSNDSTNIAVGFRGNANAQSIQGNGALVSSFVL
jgi:hypothetical protein